MERSIKCFGGIISIVFLILFLGIGDLTAQTYVVEKISDNSNIRTDRRPIHVGFYDPAVNKTFVSWMGSKSNPIVKAYDHSIGRWSEDKIVDEAPFVDKHNYPGMVKGPDGRIYLFHGSHNSTLKMAVSPEPGSIEGEWEDRFIEEAERSSYPAPIVTEEGKLYVFYRDTRKTNGYSDDRPYQVVKSEDLGSTWSRQMVIDPFPRSADNMTEIYNGKVTYEPAHDDQQEKIHIAWTIAGEKNGRHAHATYGRNVYYAYLNPANDHMYSVEGKDLGTSIDNAEADRYCLAWDSGMPDRGHYAGLQVSVHYRDNGYPLIYFYNQKEGGTNSITWNGSEWIRSKIGEEGGDPRGFEKIGPDAFRVYRPDGDSVNLYKTSNGGMSWEFETSIDVGQRISRVNVIDNFHPDAKLLLTESGDGELVNANRDVFIGKVTGAGSFDRGSWLEEARWGIMTHYLSDWIARRENFEMTPEKWNEMINAFDVEGLAEQLESVGVDYYVLTIGQNSGYYLSPNQTYDQLVGHNPGRNSERDLVADVAEALQKRDIKLIVYLPSGAPNSDEKAKEALEWQNGPYPNKEFQKKWESVIREWSLRWGDKVAGWWFDGAYWPNTMYRSYTEPNFESFADAARAGNAERIVAFNPGVVYRTISITPFEDYIAGETDHPEKMLFRRIADGKIDDGKYLHILSYLGERWGTGMPRFTPEEVAKWTNDIDKRGGVTTWDVPIRSDGLIPQPFLERLKAVNESSN